MRKQTMKVNEVKFTVEGSGPFPLDMLRYDCAFPNSEMDSNAAERMDGGLRTVDLIMRSSRDKPTFGRWASFGWTVTAVNGCPVSG